MKNNCKLCDRFIISTAVAFADGVLTVTLPAGSYADGCKYCIVIAQTIPAATTIASTVEFVIGAGTDSYPLVDRCGNPVTAGRVRTRTKYPVCVNTTATGGSFRLTRNLCCEGETLGALEG